MGRKGQIPWNKGKGGKCSVQGCERKHRTLGYCEFHWRKTEKYKEIKKKSDKKYYEKNKPKIRAKFKIYRDANKERINSQKRKAWFENHEENILKSRTRYANLSEEQKKGYAKTKHDYYLKNLQQAKKSSAKWYSKNKTKFLSKIKQRYLERKSLVVSYYSNGLMKCKICLTNGLPFLTIDHIRPRKEMGHDRSTSSDRLITEILKNDFPKGYQILCWNCNHIKEIKRPKKLSDKPRNVRDRERHRQLKIEVFTHYSGGVPKCNCCKFKNIDALAIDHIEGRKKANHPKRLGGRELYAWLKRNNYPSGFQVLCFNCNGAKRDLLECPHQSKKT